LPFAASMRQRYTLTKRCIEYGFVFIYLDLNPNWLKSDSVRRHSRMFPSEQGAILQDRPNSLDRDVPDV
jgi:hypothetical protein